MQKALGFVAHNGRYILVVGLIVGLIFPAATLALRPWLPQMVIALLFLTAFRIGPKAALAGLAGSLGTLKIAMVFQFVLPLVALGVFVMLGISATPFAIGFLLMLAAPPLTGSPNITILLDHDPEPAFRILIIGTAILPLTIIPVFWLSPDLGNLWSTIIAALKLSAAIWLVVAAAFLLRHFTIKTPTQKHTETIDGLMAIMLAVVVVGLMAAIGPALSSDPVLMLKWLAGAMIVNLGMQFLTFRVLGKLRVTEAAPFAIVSGNRNIALFLITLPAATMDPLLIFIGCYQVPMYLTAILMRRVYGQSRSAT